MKKQLLFTNVFLFLLAFTLKATDGDNNVKSNSSIRFTENKNQWDNRILYQAQLDGGVLFLEKNCFTYNFYDKSANHKNHIGTHTKTLNGIHPTKFHAFRTTFLNALPSVKTSASNPTFDYCNYFIGNDKSKWASNVKNYLKVDYENIYTGINLEFLGLQNSLKYNFYVAAKSNTNQIQLNYEGVNKIYLKKGELYIITSLNEIIEQKPYAYQIIENKKVEIPCEFILKNNIVSFNFPNGYDKNYELVIDPVLVFAAQSGSTADNFGMTATYDGQGNLYSGGTCFAQGYPTTLGAYDATYNGIVQYGRTDVVITKYNSSGTSLIYSTYIGGAIGTEIVTSLVVNAQNELLLYGATGSSDFPTTAGAFDNSFNGGTRLTFVNNGTFFNNGTDIYVAKLNATGTNLLASTFIGGNQNDGVNVNNNTQFIGWFNDAVLGRIPIFEPQSDSLQFNYGDQYRGEINIDAYGNICIASSTRSGNFPIINGFDNTLNGQQDAVVFKLKDDLSQLIWSSYLGGNDNDAGYALALDNNSNIYITGGTRSNDFPTTGGALQTVFNGGKADGYVAKIKDDGSAILFSTLWGTAAYDQSYFVQLDKNNDVYLYGQTEGNMPVTGGVYNNPNSGQFITKINNSLNTLIFSTVFGNGNGATNISPSAFLVDMCDNIYTSGWGGNIETGQATTNMPLTPNAIQSTTDGFNFYLFVLSPNATSLQYATYFGGASSQEHVDGGTSRFDKNGIVYQSVCAGCGGNDDFPVTPGAWPHSSPIYQPYNPANPVPTGTNMSDNCNNGVFKFDFEIPLAIASIRVNQQQGCAPLTVQYTNNSTPGTTYLWDFGGGDTTSVIMNPVKTYSVAGTYLAKLSVNDPASCNQGDSTFFYITVYPQPTFTTGSISNQTVCSGVSIQPIVLGTNISSSFTWIATNNPNTTGESTVTQNTGTINQTIINNTSVNQIVTYTVFAISNANQCYSAPQTFSVTVYPNPTLTTRTDTTICNNNAVNYTISSNIPSSYNWLATNNTNITGESTNIRNSSLIDDILINNTGVVQLVNYTITPTSTIGNCLGAAKTFTAIVIPTPTVTSIPPTTTCSNTALNIALNSNVPSSFLWIANDNLNTSGESTNNHNSNIINDIITNNTSAFQGITYTITLVSTTANCPGTPSSVSVTVVPRPTASVITDTTVCSNTSLHVSLSSNIPSNFNWLAGNNIYTTGESITNQNTAVINDIIVNTSGLTQSVTYTITPSSISGNCAGASSTFTAIVLPAPVVNISNATTICNNERLNIALNSNIPSTINWISNDNSQTTGESTAIQTSAPINDSITNNSTSLQLLTYSITATSSTANCIGSIQVFSVYVNPTPTINILGSTSICSGVQLNIPINANIPSSYNWLALNNNNVTGESTSNQPNSTINDLLINISPSIQTVTYTITPTSLSNGCAGIAQTYSVSVMPDVTANFNFTHNACNYQATFSNTSSGVSTGWLWNFDDNTSTSSLQNPPNHNFIVGGIYTVSLTAFGVNGCNDIKDTTLDFTDPLVSISQDTVVCVNNVVQLFASGGMSYNWLPTTGLSNSTVANPIANPNSTTTYTVTINTLTPLGDICPQTLYTTVNVTNPQLYSLSATSDKDTLYQGESTTLHAITDQSLMVTWNPTAGINNTHSFNPIVTPDVSTTYTVSILDEEGCPKTATVSIYVIPNTCEEDDIFIPNTFTPNGDGTNDVLYVRGNNITELYFAVYNRWGQAIFETTDIKKGWDGTFNSMKADPVVFAWYLKAKCYNGETIEKKGNVTLIR